MHDLIFSRDSKSSAVRSGVALRIDIDDLIIALLITY
jgi:hypothetical protein